jgi:hypothetical protein
MVTDVGIEDRSPQVVWMVQGMVQKVQ